MSILNNDAQVRVRITHKQTAKGWRVDETTVETVNGRDIDPDGIADELEALMRRSYAEGTIEAERRNATDGYNA